VRWCGEDFGLDLQRDPASLRQSLAMMAESLAGTFDKVAATYRNMAKDESRRDEDRLRLLRQADRLEARASSELWEAARLRRHG